MDIFEACRVGDLEWLKQQAAAKKLGRLMRRDQSNTLFPYPLRPFPHEYAAEGGHLDVLKWLVQESGQWIDLQQNDERSLQLAARNGHLGVVEWLFNGTGRAFDWEPMLKAAATGGKFEVCKWMLKRLYPGDHLTKLYPGDLLAKLYPEDNLVKSAIWVCSDAITFGDLDMVKWLANATWRHNDWKGNSVPDPIDFVKKDNWALMQTAFSEQLHIAQWLVLESGQKIDLTFRDHTVMEIVSGRGNQDFVRWLLRENRRNGDSEEAYQVAISSAAKARQMDLLKLIVEEWFGGKSLKKVFLGEDEADAECWQYVESTREMQETLGLRSWKTVMKEKRRRSVVAAEAKKRI